MSHKSIIVTSRTYMQELQRDDLQDLYKLDTDLEVNRYVGDISKNFTETLLWYRDTRRHYRKDGFDVYAVRLKENNEFIGLCGLRLRGDSEVHAELVYRFHKAYWGKGYATETSKAWLEKYNNITVYSFYETENLASRNVMLKLGFKPCEKVSTRYDTTPGVWMKYEPKSG